MTQVFIVEAQIVDHPDYEVFVNVKATFEEAEKIVLAQFQEENDDLGEEQELNIKEVSPGCVKYDNGMSVMYITTHEI